jgi:Uma2 family endonuclease
MRERHPMSEATPLVTAEELERFPRDDRRYELVEGRVVPMSPVNLSHGRIVVNVGALLHQHVRTHKLGVVGAEVGFKLKLNPDTVRAPDVAFIRRDRISATELKGFWSGPPDLAIEVLSPEDRASEVRAKVDEYLTRGVTVVVVIDPDRRTVTTTRRGTPPVVLQADDDRLELDDVVSGFSCQLREIFE